MKLFYLLNETIFVNTKSCTPCSSSSRGHIISLINFPTLNLQLPKNPKVKDPIWQIIIISRYLPFHKIGEWGILAPQKENHPKHE